MTETAQTITIIGSILVPMLGGFAWIIHQISDIKIRLTVVEMKVSFIERLLEMMGSPITLQKEKHSQIMNSIKKQDE